MEVGFINPSSVDSTGLYTIILRGHCLTRNPRILKTNPISPESKKLYSNSARPVNTICRKAGRYGFGDLPVHARSGPTHLGRAEGFRRVNIQVLHTGRRVWGFIWVWVWNYGRPKTLKLKSLTSCPNPAPYLKEEATEQAYRTKSKLTILLATYNSLGFYVGFNNHT